ncbi:hypothetical protein C1S65_09825 [Pseudomonas putida]|uniref:Uncharacterized protein n=1 Tax=Pseudomonas putida TaxID=303 RepID=A0AAD0PDR6_PSEPU|nr:hypothetical protein C1S65_09825 [Pseudomonas putida]
MESGSFTGFGRFHRPCGSGLARECVSRCAAAARTDAFAGKPAPTGKRVASLYLLSACRSARTGAARRRCTRRSDE